MIQNTYKARGKDTPPKKRRLSSLYTFSQDRRLSIIVGFALQGIALFLLIAFISHFSNGKADQRIIESVSETGMKASGLEIHNWLGLLGAMSAYYFIFRWFGITAFFIAFLLYVIGHKLAYKKVWVSPYRTFLFSIFSIFWLSLTLGYIDFVNQEAELLDDVLGGIGFELAILANSLIGWGTIIFLIVSLATFLVYFFNITSFPQLSFLQSSWKLGSFSFKKGADVELSTDEKEEGLTPPIEEAGGSIKEDSSSHAGSKRLHQNARKHGASCLNSYQVRTIRR